MGKLIDLTGKKFGFWTVIEKSERKSSQALWLCECICGTRKEILSGTLIRGRSTNCGCKRKVEVYVGQKFGRLTIIEEVATRHKYRHILWECLCDCGNKITTIGSCLLNGSIQSCGCYQNELSVILGKERKKYNQYDLESQDYGIGYTFKGEEFLFDKEDFNKLKDYCWYIGKNGYVYAHHVDSDGKRIQMRMHKLVMNVGEEEDIDHIKHKLYDNRKSQLRKVTQSQNNMNQKLRVDNTSGYKGVSWNKSKEQWIAYIDKENVHYDLGSYDDIEEAAKIRHKFEEELFGEYSYENSMNL